MPLIKAQGPLFIYTGAIKPGIIIINKNTSITCGDAGHIWGLTEIACKIIKIKINECGLI